ncbi:MAG: hypothetical protein R3Y39_08525 [Rikenellaceae bacterium]
MRVILYIHQLPQHLLGLLLLWLYDAEYFMQIDGSKLYVADKMSGAISLGNYIIMSNYSSTKELTQYHEYGHSRDSRRWGWLYLLVIGLPSILNAMFGFTSFYYDFWTERRADRLGGITRDEDNNRVLTNKI